MASSRIRSSGAWMNCCLFSRRGSEKNCPNQRSEPLRASSTTAVEPPALDRDAAYKTFIPAEAQERIVGPCASGEGKRVEYWWNDELVGIREFDAEGQLGFECPLRAGVIHGMRYRWDRPGALTAAEPWKNGVPHGTAYQWGEDGRVIGSYTLDEGSGLDLWWQEWSDGSVNLAEVHCMQAGRAHGFEWWLNDDQQSVHEERHWADGDRHGIEREWNSEGRLARGYPRYWVRGERVTKRQYMKAAAADPSLPPFRIEDNRPERAFPPEMAEHLGPR
jgi:hypothetical protein